MEIGSVAHAFNIGFFRTRRAICGAQHNSIGKRPQPRKTKRGAILEHHTVFFKNGVVQLLINFRHALADFIDIKTTLFAKVRQCFTVFAVVTQWTCKGNIVEIMRSTFAYWVNMVKVARMEANFLAAVNTSPTLMLHFEVKIIRRYFTHKIVSSNTSCFSALVDAVGIPFNPVGIRNVIGDRPSSGHSITLQCQTLVLCDGQVSESSSLFGDQPRPSGFILANYSRKRETEQAF